MSFGRAGADFFAMSWKRVLAMHWPVEPRLLAPFLPDGLSLDTFGQRAWLGVVPFTVSGTRAKGLLPVPSFSEFQELDVRTYVNDGQDRGVWFFSLDAANPLAALGARLAYGLPSHHARMSLIEGRDGKNEYRCKRLWSGRGAEFRARYRSAGPAFRACPGSLEHWWTHRRCLFVQHLGRLLRVDLQHEPWSLQPATVEVEKNTMTSGLGLELASVEPTLHYSDNLDVVSSMPRAARGQRGALPLASLSTNSPSSPPSF